MKWRIQMSDIGVEIGEMLESVGEKIEAKKEEAKSEVEDEGKVVVAGKDKEEEHIEQEEEKEPEPEEEDPVIKAMMAKNEMLEKKLDELMQKLATPQKEREEEKKVEEQKPAIVDFFTDDSEFDSVFEKKDQMNKMLNKVRQSAIEQVLTMMPNVTRDVINAQVVLAVKTAKFYEANPDLTQHAKVVEQIANEVMGKEPGLNLDQLFERLGKEVRDKVGIQKKVEVKEKIESQKPAFGRVGGSRKPAEQKPELSELEKQIDELLIA
jgi:prolyl oligopeptidase PreP (S9A serine peptidase family)